MSYQVLARKWRPATFSEVVGQQHVIRALMHALDQQKLHHAYLFTGTRGVGKTTLARIFAKSLNCEQGVSAHPCGQCGACEEIAAGRFPDLIEIDAASRTRVEDTRELLDNVQYAPTNGRYKVYLIDEVHMLSTHSFNALLKTLEEPPEHVKFLLATTDPQKLPITVLSRCLQFNLKALPLTQIQDQLQHILSAEEIEYEPEACALIAQAADGSMRDALSLLDQAIANCQGKVVLEASREMLGVVQQDYFKRISQALHAQDQEALMSISAALAEQYCDYAHVVASLAQWFFELAMLQHLPTWQGFTFPVADLAEQQAYFAPEVLQLYYDLLIKGAEQLPFAPTLQVGFEMLLLRLIAFMPMQAALPKAVVESAPAKKPLATKLSAQPQSVVVPAEPITDMKSVDMPPAGEALNYDETEDLAQFWERVCQHVQLSGIAKQVMLNCSVQSFQDQALALSVDPQHQAVINARLIQQIESAISAKMMKKIHLSINSGEKKLKKSTETPRQKQQRLAADRQQLAEQEIETDSHIGFMKTEFNAIIRSVQPTETQGDVE